MSSKPTKNSTSFSKLKFENQQKEREYQLRAKEREREHQAKLKEQEKARQLRIKEREKADEYRQVSDKNPGNQTKVAIISSGGAGSAFIHAAMNKKLVKEYILIDDFSDNTAMGNSLDLADVQMVMDDQHEVVVRQGSIQDLEGVELLVITTERPLKYRETRVDLVAATAKLMQEIGIAIKHSKFNGITLISSDPVEISALIYQEASGFGPNKVIGIGTLLDNARLKRLMSTHFVVPPTKIQTYMIGEHASSLMVPWSQVTIDGKSYQNYLESKFVSVETTNFFVSEAITANKAISGMRGSPVFGTAQTLIEISSAVLHNENKEMLVSAKLGTEYDGSGKGVYVSVPAVVGRNGIGQIVRLELTEEEKIAFERIVNVVEEFAKQARIAIRG